MCTLRRISDRPSCFLIAGFARVTFNACRLTLVVLALQSPVFAQGPELDIEVLRAAVESNITSISSIYATYTLTTIPNEAAAAEFDLNPAPSGPHRYEWARQGDRMAIASFDSGSAGSGYRNSFDGQRGFYYA